jgi:hypothetical protein
MSADPELRAFIDGLSREALATLLLDLAGRLPAVADALAARRRAVGGDAQKLAATIRSELSGARRRSGPWPNFEAIRDKLVLLRDAGATDAMCDLAGPIIEAGADLIEETEVAACLDLIFAALSTSSMSPDAQILWAIDMELRDPFDLCRGSAAVWDRPEPPMVWGQVADVLRTRRRGSYRYGGWTGPPGASGSDLARLGHTPDRPGQCAGLRRGRTTAAPAARRATRACLARRA